VRPNSMLLGVSITPIWRSLNNTIIKGFYLQTHPDQFMIIYNKWINSQINKEVS